MSSSAGLELYHREHGKWPESFGELSPKYLPSLPADPITGKPLHYKIVNDRPIVYSVGIDGDDDGGRLAKNKDGEITSGLCGAEPLRPRPCSRQRF